MTDFSHQKVFFESQWIGESFQNSSHLVFWGNRFGTLDKIKAAYPNLTFRSLNQVHGCDVVKSTKEIAEEFKADGHITSEKELALLIKTADCLPILFVPVKNGAPVAALHAGWRGIESEIIEALSKKIELKDMIAFIGPHIGAHNFEVGLDVATRLVSKEKEFEIASLPHPDSSKRYIDLTLIAKIRLEKLGIQNLEISTTNTFTDLDYPSYRREGGGTRMWSFVVKI